MSARPPWIVGLLAVVLTGGMAVGAEPAAAKKASRRDVRALAEEIDTLLARRWNEARAVPAPPADDAEYLRRVCLDVAGRIPTVEETRRFLRDRRPDRRERLVEELLASPRYVRHFTNVWRALLLPEANNNFQVRLQQAEFESWLKQRVARNAGYDQLARDLITAPIKTGNPFGNGAGNGPPSPLAFYVAKELKPENLAASTARVFLGVSVECAQCHNHPFADWKREQFWGFASFYAGIRSRRAMDFLQAESESPELHELTIPGTKTVIKARFLDGTDPVWKDKATSRATLAGWLTAPTNPYFARAGANRLWAYFFGSGLIDPVDDMGGASAESGNNELLDLLAREFAAHQFDVQFLIRVLTSTRAYALSSEATHPSQEARELFARMPLRGLSPEQLFDSMALATGYRDSGGGDDLLSGLIGGNRSARAEFLTRFANQSERPIEAQTSILQALTLMNGKLIASATSLARSETLTAVVEAPFATTADRVETLYLATLSRTPDAKERQRAVRFVQDAIKRAKDAKGDNGPAAREALADLFWALLNSPEFILNH